MNQNMMKTMRKRVWVLSGGTETQKVWRVNIQQQQQTANKRNKSATRKAVKIAKMAKKVGKRRNNRNKRRSEEWKQQQVAVLLKIHRVVRYKYKYIQIDWHKAKSLRIHFKSPPWQRGSDFWETRKAILYMYV